MSAKKAAPAPVAAIEPTFVSEFVERDESLQPKGDIDYDKLIHIQMKTRELDEKEQELSGKVVFYCENCKALCAATKKQGKKLKFKCNECGGEEIYFGSELGIRNFFHLTK